MNQTHRASRAAWRTAASGFVRLTAALVLMASALPAAATVTPIDYYRMGETENAAPGAASSTLDSVGSKTMTLAGAPFYQADAAAAAVSATGSSTSVWFFSGTYGSAALLTTATDNVGLEAWVKPDSIAAGDHCLVYNGTRGTSGFGIFLNGGNYQARIGSTSFGNAPATLGQWVHLALVRSGGIATFYVDGVAAATSAAAPVVPTGLFGVAASPPALNIDFYFGRVDEVRAFTFLPGAFATTDLLFAHRAVINTNDSGAGSLRAAMTTAPAGTLIDIFTTGTLTLQSMLPFVTSPLGINGPGAASFTIDGASQYRPLFIDAPSAAVQISGVTIAHGRAKGGNGGTGSFTGGGGLGAGGAMFVNRGDVTLSDVAFVANQAVGGNGGNSTSNMGSSGGGGLGGDGGVSASGDGGGSGGGGFLGGGGDAFGLSASGGGGIFGKGGNTTNFSGGGTSGGGGGGALTAGQNGLPSTGGAGADGLGGNGGNSDVAGHDGAIGLDRGGGGGGGTGNQRGYGGAGGRFGGGAGGAYQFSHAGAGAGAGGEFGGGGGSIGAPGRLAGNGGWGGGGGGSLAYKGGIGGFGGGGGTSTDANFVASGGEFGGHGSVGFAIGGAGGGGGALGAAVFVRADNGATLTVLEPQFDVGSVTAGAAGTENASNCHTQCAQGGSARGETMFLVGGSTILGVSAGMRTIAGTIGSSATAPAALVKTGAGTLALSASSIELGNATVVAGTLQVNGTLGSPLVDVNSGSTISGSGTVATLNVPAGATLSPGASVGKLTSGTAILSGAGNYNWQLRNATGAAGVGYDTLNVNGTLDVASASGFRINLWTLSSTAPDINGAASNFDAEAFQSWTLVHSTGGISGFNAANFVVVSTASNGAGGFANPTSGSFSVGVVGNDLVLIYSPPQEIAIEQPVGTNVVDGGSRNFGTSNIGTGKTLTFSVFNRGGGPDLLLTGTPRVVVSGVNAADFVVTSQPVSPIATTGGTTFDVTFTPSALGTRNASLSIANNDANENPFDILLSGTGGAPEIDVEQPAGTPLPNGGTRNFGVITIGGSVSNSFTIRNSGTGPLDGIVASVSGPNAADFSITTSPSAMVAPGGATTLTVKFASTSTGNKSATLSIGSNDADENPYLIGLTGSIDDTDIAVEQPAGSAVPDGGSRNLGNVNIGGTADFVFTIRNTGTTGSLTGLGITVDGTDAALFSIVSNPVAPVAAGGSTTFTLRVASTTRGVKNANLHIASNDPDENPYDIALSVNGIAPEIGVDQPVSVNVPNGGSRDFGSVPYGGTSSLDFTIRNGGNASLALGAASITGANPGDFQITQPPASVIGEPSGYANASFETPSINSGAWLPAPTGAQWAFGARAGIAHTGSPWFINTPPDGAQAAYIQVSTDSVGSGFSQSVTFANSGLHLIHFGYVRRGSGYAGTDIDVRMDGVTLATLPASAQIDDDWREFVVPYTNATAGAIHVLSFAGTLLDGDRATAIDNVRIEGTASMTVMFTPGGAGARSATLSIPNNDPDRNPFEIALTGTAGAGSADIQGTLADYLTDPYPGGVFGYTFKIVNAGPDNVTGLSIEGGSSALLTNFHWTCVSTPASLCPHASGIDILDEHMTQTMPIGAQLQYAFFSRVVPDPPSIFFSFGVDVIVEDPLVIDPDNQNNGGAGFVTINQDGIFRNGFDSP